VGIWVIFTLSTVVAMVAVYAEAGRCFGVREAESVSRGIEVEEFML